MNKTLVFFAISLLSLVFPAVANEMSSKAPAHAKAYFIAPLDGETVSGKFKIKFGLSGMGVAPAGVERDNTGHHHLLINTDIGSLDMGQPLPASETVKHFGGGQTETEIELPPGTHTLQLVLGNHLHVPHDSPVISEKINVVVK
jgi:hypothetical protein